MVKATQLSKTYRLPNESIHALKKADFEASAGEFVVVMGPSGAGKTTLLNLLGGLDAPTEGSAAVNGQTWSGREKERAKMRQETVGFVFQEFHLLPNLTALENVEMPLFFSRKKNGRIAHELLEAVGLEHRKEHRPPEMSGGEMQRTAIARALANRPKVLLADEPTGNLDVVNSLAVFQLFRRLADSQGLAVVAATHNAKLSALADRVVRLRDGVLHEERSPA